MKEVVLKKQTKTGRLFSVANTVPCRIRDPGKETSEGGRVDFFQNLPFKECIFTLLDLVGNVSSQLVFSPSQPYCFINLSNCSRYACLLAPCYIQNLQLVSTVSASSAKAKRIGTKKQWTLDAFMTSSVFCYSRHGFFRVTKPCVKRVNVP